MEFSTWEPEKSSWSTQERRARSTVRTPFVHLFVIIIHNHLHPKSSGHVTHDSHKVPTKAIYHTTRHYINCRELESEIKVAGTPMSRIRMNQMIMDARQYVLLCAWACYVNIQ